jgi:hypothetical protein
MYVINNMDGLYDQIGYAVAYAPDEFPYMDWRPAEEQSTLESVFKQMRDAIAIIDPKIATAEMLPRIKAILKEAHEAYISGNTERGAHLLNDWSALIFGPEP